MRLSDYEKVIHNLIEKDINDPNIYLNLQKLIYNYLLGKKMCKRYADAENISYTLAGDLYMKVLSGYYFKYFLPYIDTVILRYVLEFYNKDDREVLVFDITDDMMNSSYAANDTEIDLAITIEKAYLSDIEKVVDCVMRNSRYREGSLSYINTKLSLEISLLRGEVFSYHLSKEETDYVKFLTISFYNWIRFDGLDFKERFVNEGYSSKSGESEQE